MQNTFINSVCEMVATMQALVLGHERGKGKHSDRLGPLFLSKHAECVVNFGAKPDVVSTNRLRQSCRGSSLIRPPPSLGPP